MVAWHAYIPNRDVEGHGLYEELVRRFRARGATLLVTTDGCSSNRAEAQLAASLGLDVLVTDHHEIASGRQPVPRLVNPKADPATATRWGDLTGAGVAGLVMRELLRRRAGDEADNKFCRLLDLVALGTVADYADLGRNNRVLVVESSPEADKRMFTYQAEVELKVRRALADGEGEPITRIRTPGRPLDPDRPVDINFDVEA